MTDLRHEVAEVERDIAWKLAEDWRDLAHAKDARIRELDTQVADLLAALEEARPYCTKYGVYLPEGEFVNGYTAHNECPPPRHVLVVTEPRRRAAIAAAHQGEET